jgi:hypothetical protein
LSFDTASAARSLSQPAQRGPLSHSGKSKKFASQIRQVQFIRFRVIWRAAEQMLKSGSCGAIVLWQQYARSESVSRFQVVRIAGIEQFVLVRLTDISVRVNRY